MMPRMAGEIGISEDLLTKTGPQPGVRGSVRLTSVGLSSASLKSGSGTLVGESEELKS